MNEHLMTCSICGHLFNPQERVSCSGCPLNSGCQLLCCPDCGYQTVDTNGSLLARLVSRLFSRNSSPQITFPLKTNKRI